MENKRLMARWQDCGSLAIGLWLLVSPTVIDYSRDIGFVWAESTYLAIAIIAISILAICLPNILSEYLIFGIGVWMIASPLVMTQQVTAPEQHLRQVMLVDSVLTSVLLLIFSLWVIFEDGRLKKMLGIGN